MHREALRDKERFIFPALKKFSGFYLGGGTALALQLGHRVSVDFDLFSSRRIPDGVLSEVKRIFVGKRVRVSVNNSDELTVFIDGTKVTFLYYPFPVLARPVVYEGVKMLSVKEIAVTKAYTIGRRGSFKDYVDLYFIFRGKYVSLKNIIELAGRKYGPEFNTRLFLEQLVYLEDLEEAKLLFLKKAVTKQEIGAFFAAAVRKIKL